MNDRKQIPEVSIVIPCYNEEMNIGPVVKEIIEVMGDRAEVVVVDDGSTDDTVPIAEKAGARVVRHAYNIGNGAAWKTGIRAAHGKNIVIMDGDGQHDPQDLPRLLEGLGTFHMVVGARTSKSDTDLHRDVANRIFNTFATYLAKKKIEDLTSGFRAIRGRLAKQFAYLLPNTFSSPSTITLATIRAGYSVNYEPIEVRRRKGKSKIRPLRDAIRFFLIMLKISTLFSPLRVFLPISGLFLALGLGYYGYTYFTSLRFTNMSALLITNGVLTFLLGLVSEQIAQLRLDRSEEHHLNDD
ncbi:MAG: glycosyltransferase family 2 protein [Nitrospirota bacterium]|nr:glycosyltransferase family 2 protein [Nitrospirota bacterium]